MGRPSGSGEGRCSPAGRQTRRQATGSTGDDGVARCDGDGDVRRRGRGTVAPISIQTGWGEEERGVGQVGCGLGFGRVWTEGIRGVRGPGGPLGRPAGPFGPVGQGGFLSLYLFCLFSFLIFPFLF